MALYSCKCSQQEIKRPGRVQHFHCEGCNETVVGGTAISRPMRRRLTKAVWKPASAGALVEFIQEQTLCVAEDVSVGSDLGQAILDCLGVQRDFDAIHRNMGYVIGRGGFASSDFKKKGALRRACHRVLNPVQTEVMYNKNENHPTVQGKLIETEFAHRASERVTCDLISTEKKRTVANHPLLGTAYHVSTDGVVESSLPLEIKSRVDLMNGSKGRGHIRPTLHQMAMQAFALGVDEGVLLHVERDLTGQGSYQVIRIGNLVEYHIQAVKGWMSHDEELKGLLNALPRSDGHV